AAGTAPRLEDYLIGLPPARQTVLLKRLLTAKVRWRHGRGETPSRAEYLARFPNHRAAVDQVFPDPAREEQTALSLPEGASESEANHPRPWSMPEESSMART